MQNEQMTIETSSVSLRQPTTEADLQALINATPGISLLIDLEGIIVCANIKATVHFGIELNQLIGRNVYSLFDEATSAGRRAIATQAALQRKPVFLEDERNGIHFRHSLVPVIDPDGVVRRVAVFAEDITERKQAEIALRGSEEQYRFLAENTADTVWQLDNQMRFTYVNGAYIHLSGFPREEIIGRSVMEFFTPQGRATVAAMMIKRKENEARGEVNVALRFEVPHIRKVGDPFWAEINSNPIYDESGTITAFNGIMRDIDVSKRYEMKLEDANFQLQQQLKDIVALQSQLKEQAVRDALTGLHNRRYMEETLPREIARAKREGYPIALIMVDLDHFKRINDTFGHPTGDAVLKVMASILLHGAREGDIICRYGGEEFLVALPNMSLAQALVRAKNWQDTLRQTRVNHGTFAVETTLSAGISAFPDNSSEVETLLRLADDALYRAKANGRNRVELELSLGLSA